MKIGIDIRTLMDERYSGVSEFSVSLLSELFKADTQNEYVLFYNSFSDISERLPDFIKGKKLINPGIPNKIYNYLLTKPFNFPKVDQKLGCDVLYLPHFNFTAVKNTPIIQTVHDLSFLRYPEMFSLRKNFWHKALNVKKQLKRAQKIVAVSESTKRDVIDLAGVPEESIEVVYSGLNSRFKKLDIGSEELRRVKAKYKLPDDYILFLGTIEPRKNVEGLIKAYELLVDDMGKAAPDLVLAGGPGWKSERIYQAYEDSLVKDRIKFLGYVEDDDKCALYNLAKIFVYPSFYEGFGFPPLEAMACGIPVLVGANSSLVEVAGDSGLVVDPYNATDIYLNMKEMIQNNQLRSSLIQKGLSQVQKFTWEKTVQKYLDLFNHI